MSIWLCQSTWDAVPWFSPCVRVLSALHAIRKFKPYLNIQPHYVSFNSQFYQEVH